MSNMLENITIVFVKGEAQADGEYHKKGETLSGWVSLQYSKAGVCNAFWNYAEKRTGWAGGGGYDKKGVAFAEAINKAFGTKYRNNGEGLNYTINELKRDGFQVKEMFEVNR
jgi:hypothetical protein